MSLVVYESIVLSRNIPAALHAVKDVLCERNSCINDSFSNNLGRGLPFEKLTSLSKYLRYVSSS